MTREIKFRAWDEFNQVMVIPMVLGNPVNENSSYLYMQCTGRKDMCGKEIYEGDICRSIESHYKKEDEEVIGQIVWNSFNACFEFDFCYWGMDASSTFEVIGNVYENPELLEVKNDSRN